MGAGILRFVEDSNDLFDSGGSFLWGKIFEFEDLCDFEKSEDLEFEDLWFGIGKLVDGFDQFVVEFEDSDVRIEIWIHDGFGFGFVIEIDYD